MVRPRTGDFKYSKTEIDVMIEDIRIFKELSIAGVVFGVLTCGGRVDVGKTELFSHTTLCMAVSVLMSRLDLSKRLSLCKVIFSCCNSHTKTVDLIASKSAFTGLST